MIDKDNLERKDFSIVLPNLIAKIQFVGSSLINSVDTTGRTIEIEDEFMYGSGLILYDVLEDLQAINKALYPEKSEESSSNLD